MGCTCQEDKHLLVGLYYTTLLEDEKAEPSHCTYICHSGGLHFTSPLDKQGNAKIYEFAVPGTLFMLRNPLRERLSQDLSQFRFPSCVSVLFTNIQII